MKCIVSLANAYAIPPSVWTDTAALLAALASAVPHAQWLAGWAAQGAHIALEAVMWPTRELAELPIASIRVAAAPGWLTLLALAGLVLAMLPRGVPGTWRAWLWLLPALAWLPGRPSHGDWEATVLDVGQAAAVLVRTARTLLFDAGALTPRPTVIALLPRFTQPRGWAVGCAGGVPCRYRSCGRRAQPAGDNTGAAKFCVIRSKPMAATRSGHA